MNMNDPYLLTPWAVLISIRPEWCEKILRGEKTIEVRKNRPKLKTPFKCYIYCTKPKREYEDYIELEYPLPQFFGGGKVVGEFTCDRIFQINVLDNGCIKDWNYEHMEMACLGYDELAAYIGKGNHGYGWHISDARVFVELPSFKDTLELDLPIPRYRPALYEVERPPQSWRYMQELDGME